MSKKDRRLGMHADISRRDFLHGMSVAIGASLLPASAPGSELAGQDLPGYYPPGRSGMRGSHPGSFETAHLARDGKTWDSKDTGEHYDLVVVGAGISGLSAAWYYRQAMGPDARILVLDNHDDFGGHAKRNEFQIDGRLMIGYGGTQSLEAPGGYPAVAKELIRELGIDTQRFYDAFDRDLYRSLGLQRGVFFDRETFGKDHLAIGAIGDPAVLANAPLSDNARAQLLRLYADKRHYLSDIPRDKKLAYLESVSYETYLRDLAGLGDEALRAVRSRPRGLWAIGADALPALTAWSSGYAGFGGLQLDISSYRREDEEPYIFHFPDGNASVARLLVRSLIPAVAAGDDMEDVVTARFDYRRLDEAQSAVRIRLSSTAVRVRHIDDKLANPVRVSYLRDGAAHAVTGEKVVMACYHAIIPRLCPELPETQRAALAAAQRAPLVYTNVLLRHWKSFDNLGLQSVHCPGGYHHDVTLDFPVSLGNYRCPASPNEPMILHMTRVPIFPGLSAREQFAAGKRELLATSFETFERNIRDQLSRVLAGSGFDAARDIAGITVNRWPHGYAYGYDPQTDRIAFEPDHWPQERRHWLKARRSFGNISIAATDAAANAMTESAIEEAHRAVQELR